MSVLTYTVTQPRPGDAVAAYRDFLIASLQRMIAAESQNAAAAVRVKESARIAGRIEQLATLKQLLETIAINEQPV